MLRFFKDCWEMLNIIFPYFREKAEKLAWDKHVKNMIMFYTRDIFIQTGNYVTEDGFIALSEKILSKRGLYGY